MNVPIKGINSVWQCQKKHLLKASPPMLFKRNFEELQGSQGHTDTGDEAC